MSLSFSIDDINVKDPIKKWITLFLMEIVFHIDFGNIFPKALDNTGLKLFNKAAFWILYTRFKISQTEASQKKQVLITIINSACLYKLDDITKLYYYFSHMVILFFDKTKVIEYISNKSKMTISSSIIPNEYYSYLLPNGNVYRNEIFGAKFTSNNNANNKEVSLYEKYAIKSSKDNTQEKEVRFTVIGHKHGRNEIEKGSDNLIYEPRRTRRALNLQL